MSSIDISRLDENSVVFSFTNGSLDVTIRNGDICQETSQAIVNPTNVSMAPSGGIDSLMHDTMGQYFTDQVVSIYKDRKEHSCPVGQSRIFLAKFSPIEREPRFIINTAGPVYTEEEKERASFSLQSCYYTSLALANLYQLSSIAYPAISCGVHHFPAHEAARMAIDSIRQFAFNIKDVRFVLYDKHLYDIYLQEWTDYAQNVNKEASAVDPTSESVIASETPPSVPSKLSARYCVLCKEKQLPVDRELLCSSCSHLDRSQIFKNVLSRLRTAGETSYDTFRNECEVLKAILHLYPLVYTPAQKYDPSVHKVDLVAEKYLFDHCQNGFRSTCLPITVVGDGTCFYNSFVKLVGVGTSTDASTVTAAELRARNVLELVLNIDAYRSQYARFEAILDSYEEYVTKEMVRDTSNISVWDLFSIPTVLNITVISVYPMINGSKDFHYQSLNEALFIPLLDENDVNGHEKKKAEMSVVSNEVRLLFSNCNAYTPDPSEQKVEWLSNHFVPLLFIK